MCYTLGFRRYEYGFDLTFRFFCSLGSYPATPVYNTMYFMLLVKYVLLADVDDGRL